MTVNYIKTMAALTLVAASAIASATPLSDYNLILSGDLNVSGGSGHIEGKSFIGGNVVNGSIFSQKLDKSSTEDTVKVVGNFASNGAMHVEAGYVAYQGTFSGPTTICNGTGMGQSGCLKQISDGSLTTEKTSLLAELASEGNYYSGLATSSGTSITGDSNNKTFAYTGAATDLAVFNISAFDLANINWTLSLGNAINVLINVTDTGSSFNAGNAHVNNGFQNNANNVLWNFGGVSDLFFGDSWYGSILALDVTIHTGSNLNGAIAAKSYVGNGEIHNYHWSYTPPKPPVEVSEPSTLLLSLLGLSMVLIGRVRRQK
jgi:choice-of-anchor A domain-containing protein